MLLIRHPTILTLNVFDCKHSGYTQYTAGEHINISQSLLSLSFPLVLMTHQCKCSRSNTKVGGNLAQVTICFSAAAQQQMTGWFVFFALFSFVEIVPFAFKNKFIELNLDVTEFSSILFSFAPSSDEAFIQGSAEETTCSQLQYWYAIPQSATRGWPLTNVLPMGDKAFHRP